MLSRIRLLLGLSFIAATAGMATTYTVNTNTLNSYSGVHPRLFLDTNTINTLRASLATTNSPYATVWNTIKANADSIVQTVPWTNNPSSVADPAGLWQRTVGNNIATLSMAYLMTKQTVADDTYWIEAEETPLVAPMAVYTNDTTASGLKYIATPGGASNTSNSIPANASYPFFAGASRTYYLWARTIAANTGSDSLWVNFDGATNQNLGVVTNSAWTWNYLMSTNLSAGPHQLEITYREQGLKIDKFLLTSDSGYHYPGGTKTPSGVSPEQHWLEAEKFTLNAGGSLAVTSTDPMASAGAFLVAPAGTAGRSATPASTATPDAQQTVTVSGSTNYDLWVSAKSFNTGSDSFYYAVDSGAYTYTGIGSPYSTWGWTKAASNVSLAAGDHLVKLMNRETGCELDRVVVVPTGTAMPTNPNTYLVSALAWSRAACNYSPWGDGTQDLPVGHLLLGLGVLYDWAYSDIGSGDLQTLQNTLASRGAALYAGIGSSYWKTEWLQNHMWICMTGLTAAATAIYGDPGATSNATLQTWLTTSMSMFNNTMNDLGPDGASQEGVGYWEYGVEWLLKYMDISKKLLGADMYATPWFQKTPYYRLYFSLPQNSWTPAAQSANKTMGYHIDFADDPRVEWYGPGYLLRGLAMHNTTDTNAVGAAQWLATQLDANNANALSAPWLNLVWYNPSLAEVAPTNQPTFYHFDDLDFTVSRSGWDGNESVLAYQCGPFMGRGVQMMNTNSSYVDWGGSHVHPVANNFCLFGNGDWLIHNDGYTGLKLTGYDNTLLVSNPNDANSGQLGEGAEWFTAAPARYEMPAINTTNSFSTPQLDYLVGDAVTAYDSATGLTKYRRHMLFLKPNVLVVVDDVTLSTPRTLELRFFPEQATAANPATNVYTTLGTNSAFRFQQLTPTTAALTQKTIPFVTSINGTTTNSINHLAFSVAPSSTTTNWSNAVAMSWSAKTSTPVPVTFIQETNAWKFQVASQKQTIVLDRDANEHARVVTAFEAESVTPLSPMSVYTNDADASGGAYITATSGANNPDTLPSPNASYLLSIPAAGSYTIWARAKGADASSDSFWYAMNPGAGAAFTNVCYLSPATYGTWAWVKLATFSLSSGTNTLAIKTRESNCKLDQFIVTDDSTYTPTGKY